MPIVAGGWICEVLVKGITNTEETINRFFYGGITSPDDLDAWLTSLHNHLIPTWLAILSNNAAIFRMEAQEIRGGTRFTTRVETEVGLISGDSCPPFVAWDYTLVRGGAFERNGYKRIAGVPEVMQANGVRTSGSIPDLDTFATTLGSGFVHTLITYGPVIRRTKVNKVTQHPPVFYDCSGAIYSKIGSQNSRKIGHGR